MKSAKILVLLCLTVFASASFAASSPLNNPRGLAVDAKGNLYVANTLGGAPLEPATLWSTAPPTSSDPQ